MNWSIPDGLPLVQTDQYSLLQVFLNLARNSHRALERVERREISVDASAEAGVVLVRFRDTGPGVSNPDDLFRPFHPGAEEAGLGLYVSRAILRSYDGDLRYEPQSQGSCFVVELRRAEGALSHERHRAENAYLAG